MEDAAPTIGHNNPPVEAHDPEVYETLSAGVERFNDAAAEWLKLGTIENAEQAEKLTDFLAGARKMRQTVEKNRKDQKAKWDDLGKKVQADYKVLFDRIDLISKKPISLQTDWLRREKEAAEQRRLEAQRKAEEEARRAEELRRQAEARNDVAGMADAEAAEKVAEKARKAAEREAKVKAGSASGGTRSMGLRTVKSAKVTNIAKLFMHYKDRPEVEEVLVRLANADLRSKDVPDESIPGIEIFTEEKAV